jgi:hypothetical protein
MALRRNDRRAVKTWPKKWTLVRPHHQETWNLQMPPHVTPGVHGVLPATNTDSGQSWIKVIKEHPLPKSGFRFSKKAQPLESEDFHHGF